MNARSLLGLLFHAEKALDLVATAHAIGLIARLDAGPVALGTLAEATGARPQRLYKFLDGLESLGLILREQAGDDLLAARYVSREPLQAAVEAVLGPGSIERDRNGYAWREVHGRLRDVLAGRLHARFPWPPADDADVRMFEASMAAGTAPIVQALRGAREILFARPAARPEPAHAMAARSGVRFAPRATRRGGEAGPPPGWATVPRWLDVGGGDGTVAEALMREERLLSCDVYNLPAVAPLVHARAREANLTDRLGFVGGDFLCEPLPAGYDLLSFIRVLHDWPPEVARALLRNARQALGPGGRIIICEEFRTADRLAVQFFWTYFLIGVDTCVSRLREAEWYTGALADLGFTEICVIPGAFDLITAVAP